MQNRTMRRKDRKMPDDVARSLLESGEYGVLSTITPSGGPYGVPISYVYMDGSIYIHCAREGFKVECFESAPPVSFVVVGKTRPIYVKDFTTYYESVMAGGKIEAVDGDEKRAALYALARKYLPEHMDKADADIAKSFSRTAVYAIRVDFISGKAKRPLNREY